MGEQTSPSPVPSKALASPPGLFFAWTPAMRDPSLPVDRKIDPAAGEHWLKAVDRTRQESEAEMNALSDERDAWMEECGKLKANLEDADEQRKRMAAQIEKLSRDNDRLREAYQNEHAESRKLRDMARELRGKLECKASPAPSSRDPDLMDYATAISKLNAIMGFVANEDAEPIKAALEAERVRLTLVAATLAGSLVLLERPVLRVLDAFASAHLMSDPFRRSLDPGPDDIHALDDLARCLSLLQAFVSHADESYCAEWKERDIGLEVDTANRYKQFVLSTNPALLVLDKSLV